MGSIELAARVRRDAVTMVHERHATLAETGFFPYRN